MVISWGDEYSLGIEVIDNQHKEFLRILHSLSDSLTRSAPLEEVNRVISELESYANMHLNFEEENFKKFSYEGSDDHMKEHDSFRKKIREFRGSYQKEDVLVAIEMLSFLEDWLIKHIKVSDRKYVDCFRSHGLT